MLQLKSLTMKFPPYELIKILVEIKKSHEMHTELFKIKNIKILNLDPNLVLNKNAILTLLMNL